MIIVVITVVDAAQQGTEAWSSFPGRDAAVVSLSACRVSWSCELFLLCCDAPSHCSSLSLAALRQRMDQRSAGSERRLSSDQQGASEGHCSVWRVCVTCKLLMALTHTGRGTYCGSPVPAPPAGETRNFRHLHNKSTECLPVLARSRQTLSRM